MTKPLSRQHVSNTILSTCRSYIVNNYMLIVSSISVIHKLILTTLLLTRYLEARIKLFFIANCPLSHPRGVDKNSPKCMRIITISLQLV